MKKRTRIIIAATAAVIAVGGGIGAYVLLNRTSPEETFFAALAKSESSDSLASIEENADKSDSKVSAQAIGTKDGIKAKGTFQCTGSSVYGDIAISMDFTQVNEKTFLQYTTVTNSNGDDPAFDKELNDFFASELVGKHILIDDADVDALSLKRYGTTFNTLGATSTKLSGEEIVAKLQEHKVIEILNTRTVTHKGASATEYSLQVRRSAYEKFIDSVVPGYSYKDQVLDTIFADDTEEITVVLDNKNQYAYATYSMENPCYAFLAQFDPEAVADLPSRVRIKNYQKDVQVDVSAPADYISAEDYANIFLSEEE